MIKQAPFQIGRVTGVSGAIIGILAALLAVTALPSAAADANSCSYVRDLDSAKVTVSWDVDDLKRVNVRDDDGWIVTVQAPDTSVDLGIQPREQTYTVVAKTNDGERSILTCTEIPVVLDGDCTWVDVTVSSIRVSWDIADLKRVNVRDDNGWMATVDAPETTVTIDRGDQGDVYILAKTQDGNTERFDCDQVIDEPFLQAKFAVTDGPTCVERSEISGRLWILNTFGSLNLRDSDGWVKKLGDSERPLVPAGDSYSVVVRNPISGTETLQCTSGAPTFVEKIWGGQKASLTPNLLMEHPGFKIEDVPTTADYTGDKLVNKTTGKALDISTGDEWAVTGVSSDGTILLVTDFRTGEYYELHLSNDSTSFTYFRIG